MTDYTGATIKLPQEVALSLDQQLTRQHKVKIKTTLINRIHYVKFLLPSELLEMRRVKFQINFIQCSGLLQYLASRHSTRELSQIKLFSFILIMLLLLLMLFCC